MALVIDTLQDFSGDLSPGGAQPFWLRAAGPVHFTAFMAIQMPCPPTGEAAISGASGIVGGTRSSYDCCRLQTADCQPCTHNQHVCLSGQPSLLGCSIGLQDRSRCAPFDSVQLTIGARIQDLASRYGLGVTKQMTCGIGMSML